MLKAMISTYLPWCRHVNQEGRLSISRENRPAGLVLFTLYFSLTGLLLAGWGCWALVLGTQPWLGDRVLLTLLLALFMGIVQLAQSYGLWTLQPWGRQLTLSLSALSAVYTVLVWLRVLGVGPFPPSPILLVLSLLLSLAALVYFNLAPVKAAFLSDSEMQARQFIDGEGMRGGDQDILNRRY
jgi:hypothetical protein